MAENVNFGGSVSKLQIIAQNASEKISISSAQKVLRNIVFNVRKTGPWEILILVPEL